MARVLLISNNDSFGLKVLYCLHAAGYEVDILSIVANNYIRYSRYRSHFHKLNSNLSVNELQNHAIEWINRRFQSRNWEAVLADSVSAHGFLHSIRSQLKVPVYAPNSLEELQKCHDKWTFYTTLKNAGIPIPNSELLMNLDALTPEVANRVGYPLMVKPLNEEASNGVIRFDNYEGLSAYLRSPGPFKSFPLKIQRFISGPTFGISIVALSGEIISYDVQLHGPLGGRIFYEEPKIVEVAKKIIKVFNYGGPAHIDFVREDSTGEFFAIDFNPRFWFSTTVCMWRGGNFPEKAVKLARNEYVPVCSTKPGTYFPPGAVVKLLKRQPSRLVKLDKENWKGFWQAVSDPLPHLVNKLL
jgi:biotin carboxylase